MYKYFTSSNFRSFISQNFKYFILEITGTLLMEMQNLSYFEILESVTMEIKNILFYKLHHILQCVIREWYVKVTSQTLEISQNLTSRNIRMHAHKDKICNID